MPGAPIMPRPPQPQPVPPPQPMPVPQHPPGELQRGAPMAGPPPPGPFPPQTGGFPPGPPSMGFHPQHPFPRAPAHPQQPMPPGPFGPPPAGMMPPYGGPPLSRGFAPAGPPPYGMAPPPWQGPPPGYGPPPFMRPPPPHHGGGGGYPGLAAPGPSMLPRGPPPGLPGAAFPRPPHGGFGGPPPPSYGGAPAAPAAYRPPAPPMPSGPSPEDAFFKLLEEAGVTAFSSWTSTQQKIAKDARFLAIKSPPDRKKLFDKFAATIGRREAERKMKDAEAAWAELSQLLRAWVGGSEDAPPASSFPGEGLVPLAALPLLSGELQPRDLELALAGDPRYQALDARQRDLLWANHVHAAVRGLKAREGKLRAEYRSLLMAVGADAQSRWSSVREKIRGREPAGMPPAQLEAWFHEFREKLAGFAAQGNSSTAAEESSRRVREAQAKEAAAQFRVLLTEQVRDTSAGGSFAEVFPRLQKDPLGRAKNGSLSVGDYQREYAAHLESLHASAVQAFKQLVRDVCGPRLEQAAEEQLREGSVRQLEAPEGFSDYRGTVARLLADDPRYDRLAALEERKREALYFEVLLEMKFRVPPSFTPAEDDGPGSRRGDRGNRRSRSRSRERRT